MDAVLVSDEGDCNQNEHHDQDDALFVLREFEDSEEAPHFIRYRLCHVERSETSLAPLP